MNKELEHLRDYPTIGGLTIPEENTFSKWIKNIEENEERG